MRNKVIISTLLVCTLTLSTLISPVAAAKQSKTVALSKKSFTITVGSKKTLKLKNAEKKVKWKVKNKKVVRIVSQKGKFKNKIQFMGIAAGTTKITAKCGKKKYTTKITVKGVTNVVEPIAKVNETTAPSANNNNPGSASNNSATKPAETAKQNETTPVAKPNSNENVTTPAVQLPTSNGEEITSANVETTPSSEVTTGNENPTTAVAETTPAAEEPATGNEEPQKYVQMNVGGTLKTTEDEKTVLELELIIVNTTDNQYYIKNEYGKLEKEVDGAWEEVSVVVGNFNCASSEIGTNYTKTLPIYIGNYTTANIPAGSSIALGYLGAGYYRYSQNVYNSKSNIAKEVSATFYLDEINLPEKEIVMKTDSTFAKESSSIYTIPFYFVIENPTQKTLVLGKEFGKLERLVDDEWNEVQLNHGPAEEILIYLAPGAVFRFDYPITVGIDLIAEDDNENKNGIKLSELPKQCAITKTIAAGHYRYTHYYSVENTDIYNAPISVEFDITE
jgi:hypothetical protein